MRRPVVLIIGAGGFIGGWIAEALHLTGGASVRAGVDNWSSAARIARFPIDIIRCDIMDRDSLKASLAGTDVVIHCARGKGNDNNVATVGTRLLLETCAQQGIPKLIFLSSVAVYGDVTGLVDENTLPAPPVSIYGQGKRVAEEICREFACERLSITVFRPTLVFGPFSEQWSIPYISRLFSGRWRALGERGKGKCNLIYVGDLVRFSLYAIENNLGPFSIFNANGPEVTTWNSYIERFNAALGLPPLQALQPTLSARVAIRRPIRSLGKYMLANHPAMLAALANKSATLRAMMRRVEYDLRIMPNDDEIHSYSKNVTYSMAAANAAGFKPLTNVDEGLALTVDWARCVGLIGAHQGV